MCGSDPARHVGDPTSPRKGGAKLLRHAHLFCLLRSLVLCYPRLMSEVSPMVSEPVTKLELGGGVEEPDQ